MPADSPERGPAGARRRHDYLAHGLPYDGGTSVVVEQRYTYTGREDNPASSLMYYRYRQYDPGVGRFSGRDAFANAPEPVLYDYTISRPVIYTDAYGLTWKGVDSPKPHHGPVPDEEGRLFHGLTVPLTGVFKGLLKFKCVECRPPADDCLEFRVQGTTIVQVRSEYNVDHPRATEIKHHEQRRIDIYKRYHMAMEYLEANARRWQLCWPDWWCRFLRDTFEQERDRIRANALADQIVEGREGDPALKEH
jgi:RHS repeat-associated protein